MVAVHGRRCTTTFSSAGLSFLQHYHKRSNVESTFSMMKRKFGTASGAKPMLRWSTKRFVRFSAITLSVLIHETHELGIDPVFWKQDVA